MSAYQNVIKAINKEHALLVFPIKAQKEPLSIWKVLHPRKKMRWEWDEHGDGDVHDLWHLRGKLSNSPRVFYTKLYKNRACFLSLDFFSYLWNVKNSNLVKSKDKLSSTATQILNELEDNSPQSPRQLKKTLGLRGKDNLTAYQRALKELWQSLMICGFGEIDDGAFPSLGLGASRYIHERSLTKKASSKQSLDSFLKPKSLIYNYFKKYLNS